MLLKVKLLFEFNKGFVVLVILIFFTNVSKAQLPKEYNVNIELQAGVTTSKVVPFWMRSNQSGSIPLSGLSLSTIGSFSKDFNSTGNKRTIDWGFSIEARANIGSDLNGKLIESYLKGKVSIFQLKVGRSRDVMGLNGDTLLTSGNFAISGNALGVPKVEISIPDYYRLNVLDGILSLKGNFSHGWVGKEKILDSIGSLPPSTEIFYIQNNNPKTYLHQKSLYLKLGREDWKLNLIGGFSHQAYWGNEQKSYGSNFKLTPFETFLYVATGKAYGTKGVPTSKIGNQLGSIDLGINYNFANYDVLFYRQFFYDVGALSKLANIADGLTGVSFTNKSFVGDTDQFQWSKILLEVFYSKNQAGYPWSTPTKSGDEDYYNNFYYVNGWSFNGLGLGNPLITKRDDAKSGQANREIEYFLNNRVVALHLGIKGKYQRWDFTSKITYSKNYGTFGTSIYGSSTGDIRSSNTENIYIPTNQFSFQFNGLRPLKNNLQIGFVAAIDQGSLLEESMGLLLRIRKSFN